MTERSLSFNLAARRIRATLAIARPRRLSVDGCRPAAVLIPILRRPRGPTLLFTRRTETLPEHAGQISFPGGRCEKGEDAALAALREASEEVGLDPESVEIAGSLDDHLSISRYVVTPVVGLIADPPAVFGHSVREVREPFEVPLARLLDTGRVRFEWWDRTRIPPGAPVEKLLSVRAQFEEFDPQTGRYKVYFFDSGAGSNHVIWGLTARILKDLLDRSFNFTNAAQVH